MHPDQDAEHPWLARRGRVHPRSTRSRGAAARRLPRLAADRTCRGRERRARRHGRGRVDEVVLNEPGGRIRSSACCRPGRRLPVALLHLRAPPGAELLAESDAAQQGYRLGERTWAIQFHAEVTRHMLDRWFTEGEAELPDPTAVRERTNALLGGWNEHGRRLCGAFLGPRSGNGPDFVPRRGPPSRLLPRVDRELGRAAHPCQEPT